MESPNELHEEAAQQRSSESEDGGCREVPGDLQECESGDDSRRLSDRVSTALILSNIKKFIKDIKPIELELIEFMCKPIKSKTADDKKKFLPYLKEVSAFKNIGLRDVDLGKVLY